MVCFLNHIKTFSFVFQGGVVQHLHVDVKVMQKGINIGLCFKHKVE